MFENLSLGTNAAVFGAAALVVWVAGTRLARYADQIAEKTGIGRELLGILLLGGVTSLPELAVGVSATMAGSPVLSVNDVLGSAAINVVILAEFDAVYGRNALTSTPASPAVMLQGALGILMLSLVVGAGIAGDVLVWGMGAWSWLLLTAFLCAVWVIWKSQGISSWLPTKQSPAPVASSETGTGHDDGSLRTLLLHTVGVGAAILVAGFVLPRSDEALAEETGLGTSAPTSST